MYSGWTPPWTIQSAAATGVTASLLLTLAADVTTAGRCCVAEGIFRCRHFAGGIVCSVKADVTWPRCCTSVWPMSLVLCLRPAVYRQGEQSLRRLGRATFDPFSAALRDNPSFRQLSIATLSPWKQDVMRTLSCWCWSCLHIAFNQRNVLRQSQLAYTVTVTTTTTTVFVSAVTSMLVVVASSSITPSYNAPNGKHWKFIS